MRRWKYEIDGVKLRELVNGEQEFETLVQLEKDLKQFIPKIEDGYMKGQFEELYYLVEGEVQEGEEGLERFLEEEDAQDDLQELVNDRLAEFYDLCDGFRVWITL